MRRFFVLTENSRQRGVQSLIPTYPVLGPSCFDSSQVFRCQRLPDDCLMAGKLLEKAGQKVDLVGNSMGWTIGSPDLLRIFDEFATDDVQFLRLNAVDANGKPVLTDCRVVNVLRCLDRAIDLERSVTSHHNFGNKDTLNIIIPAFRVSEIPPSTHVFRPQESLFTLVVSQEFVAAITNPKLAGFSLVETLSV